MVNVIASQTKREAERSTGTIDGQTDGQSSHDRAGMTKKKKYIVKVLYIYRERMTSADNEGLLEVQ
jgi:hypothetical protein